MSVTIRVAGGIVEKETLRTEHIVQAKKNRDELLAQRQVIKDKQRQLVACSFSLILLYFSQRITVPVLCAGCVLQEANRTRAAQDYQARIAREKSAAETISPRNTNSGMGVSAEHCL